MREGRVESRREQGKARVRKGLNGRKRRNYVSSGYASSDPRQENSLHRRGRRTPAAADTRCCGHPLPLRYDKSHTHGAFHRSVRTSCTP